MIDDFKKKLDSITEKLITEFSKISINKANIALLDEVKIKYFDDYYKINQLSVMNVNGNTIDIKPFDKKNIPLISKEIINLNMDLNPFVNGDVLKVVFPKMTQERRILFTKKIKSLSEDIKISVRNNRRIYIQKIKNLSKNKEISKDEEILLISKIDLNVNECIKKINDLTEKKNTDLLKI